MRCYRKNGVTPPNRSAVRAPAGRCARSLARLHGPGFFFRQQFENALALARIDRAFKQPAIVPQILVVNETVHGRHTKSGTEYIFNTEYEGVGRGP